jgi:hypothetical protein
MAPSKRIRPVMMTALTKGRGLELAGVEDAGDAGEGAAADRPRRADGGVREDCR